MKRTTLGIVAIAAISLALPATSLANLPKPKDPTIKVAKSIGGIEIGMAYKKAEKQWGGNGDCTFDQGVVGNCSYTKGNDYEKGAGDIQVSGGDVTAVSIGAGRSSSGKLIVTGAMAAFQTPEGIGLADPASKVKKAYKKAEHLTTGGYLIPGKGKSSMVFNVDEHDKISSINLIDGEHQG
jgi:hypothetical protein